MNSLSNCQLEANKQEKVIKIVATRENLVRQGSRLMGSCHTNYIGNSTVTYPSEIHKSLSDHHPPYDDADGQPRGVS